MRCDKLSTAVATVSVHPDEYKKDFDAVAAFLTQYINKRAPTPSVKVTSVMQTRPARWQNTESNHGSFKGKPELEKYSKEEYDLMSIAQHQQLHELWNKTGLIKGKKTPESNKAFKARVSTLEAKTDNSTNESLFSDEKPKANNRNNPALDRKGNCTRQCHADT